MPRYSYRATDSLGHISQGTTNAAGERELIDILSQTGLELIEAKTSKKTFFQNMISERKCSMRTLAAFSTSMKDILEAGLPFDEALKEAISLQNNKNLTNALAHISSSIEKGCGIEAAFAAHSRVFPEIYSAMIGAGEASGDMAKAFDFLAAYTENAAVIEEKIKRALRYPAFLLLVSGGATAFMMTEVVPQIAFFINSIDAKLPLFTRMLLATSDFILANGLTCLGLLALSICFLFIARKTSETFAIFSDKIILRIPVIGKIIRLNSSAKFARSFSMLFRSGCDIQTCIQKACDAVGNLHLKNSIKKSENKIIEGSSLSASLGWLFPSFASGLIRTGEISGNLAKSISDAAVACEREAQKSTDALITSLEPALTLAIGGILVWTVAAALGPLYGSLSVLGARI